MVMIFSIIPFRQLWDSICTEVVNLVDYKILEYPVIQNKQTLYQFLSFIIFIALRQPIKYVTAIR